jgi:hypothetical protein
MRKYFGNDTFSNRICYKLQVDLLLFLEGYNHITLWVNIGSVRIVIDL